MQQRVTEKSLVFDPATCDHPAGLCEPELDPLKQRVLRCMCGVVRPLASEYDDMIWFNRRVNMVAGALLRGDRAEALALAEGV